MAWEELATLPPYPAYINGSAFYRPVDNTIVVVGGRNYAGIWIYEIDNDEWVQATGTLPVGLDVSSTGPKVSYDPNLDQLYVLPSDVSTWVGSNKNMYVYSSNSLENRNYTSYASTSTVPFIESSVPHFNEAIGVYIWHKWSQFYISSSEVSNTVVERHNGMTLAVEDEFFCFGGIDGMYQPAMNIEYCVLSGSFEFEIIPVTLPVEDYWIDASTISTDGPGYIAGGTVLTEDGMNYEYTDRVFSFDGLAFAELDPLPETRIQGALVATPDGLYYIGGVDGSFANTVTNYFLPLSPPDPLPDYFPYNDSFDTFNEDFWQDYSWESGSFTVDGGVLSLEPNNTEDNHSEAAIRSYFEPFSQNTSVVVELFAVNMVGGLFYIDSDYTDSPSIYIEEGDLMIASPETLYSEPFDMGEHRFLRIDFLSETMDYYASSDGLTWTLLYSSPAPEEDYVGGTARVYIGYYAGTGTVDIASFKWDYPPAEPVPPPEVVVNKRPGFIPIF